MTPTSAVSFQDAARRWLSSYVPTVRGERDQRLAKQRVRDYLNRFMGHTLLHRVTGEDVPAYRLWLEKRKLSTQTVKHILSDLRCFLNWCEDSGLVERTPFPRRVLPRVPGAAARPAHRRRAGSRLQSGSAVRVPVSGPRVDGVALGRAGAGNNG